MMDYFNVSGQTPDVSEALTILVITGSRMGRHSLISHNGIVSSEQVLLVMDLKVGIIKTYTNKQTNKQT